MNPPLPPAAPLPRWPSLRRSPRRTRPLVKAALWLAFALYAAALVYVVFLARRRRILVWTPDLVNLVPLLNTIREHDGIVGIGYWNYWSNIFGNMALFVPLPTLLAGVTGIRGRWWLFGLGVATSVFIEAAQYASHDGVPDIDDVIFNSTGTLLGLALWELVFRKILRWLAP